MKVLCVAPLAGSEPFLLSGCNVVDGMELGTRFENRDAAQTSVTEARASEAFNVDKNPELKELSSQYADFNVRVVWRYEHFGMEFLCSIINFSEQLTINTPEFESRTTNFFIAAQQILCPTSRSTVRWVNRTLLVENANLDLSSMDKNDKWFQQPPSKSIQLTDSAFYPSWGNNVLIYGDPRGPRLAEIVGPIIFSQFLWCYLSDIEAESTRYLGVVGSRMSIRNELLLGVIELHHELAVESMLRERTRVESAPQFRQVVEAVLAAWEYQVLHDDVDRRLNRLEHIVQNRSELIRREQNKRMDWTLFALAGTTIVSLALTFIQTAYAQLDDGRRPKGQLMEWLIATNSSRVVAISFALTTLLIVGVTVFSGRIPSGKRKKQNVSSRRPHGCCGEKSTIR